MTRRPFQHHATRSLSKMWKANSKLILNDPLKEGEARERSQKDVAEA